MTTIDRRGGHIAKDPLTKWRGEGAEYPAHLVGGWFVGFEVPGPSAINFLLEDVPAGGGMASLRNDPWGKGLVQILLSMPVEIPRRLLSTGFPPDDVGDKQASQVIVGAGA